MRSVHRNLRSTIALVVLLLASLSVSVVPATGQEADDFDQLAAEAEAELQRQLEAYYSSSAGDSMLVGGVGVGVTPGVATSGPRFVATSPPQTVVTRNANGTYNIVFACAGLAGPDAAGTRSTCAVNTVSGDNTLPGPVSAAGNVAFSVADQPGLRACAKAVGFFIDGSSLESPQVCTFIEFGV